MKASHKLEFHNLSGSAREEGRKEAISFLQEIRRRISEAMQRTISLRYSSCIIAIARTANVDVISNLAKASLAFVSAAAKHSVSEL